MAVVQGCDYIKSISTIAGAITEPKMFRLDYTTAIIRLLYGWPPYIFLFGELLGAEREIIEMEVSMPRIAIRHTLL